MRTEVHSIHSLNPSMGRFIVKKEKELNRTCRTIWQFTNPKGETFLFGSFCRNYNKLIVTLGHYNPCVNGFFLPARN